jgi:hypothetical protein
MGRIFAFRVFEILKIILLKKSLEIREKVRLFGN